MKFKGRFPKLNLIIININIFYNLIIINIIFIIAYKIDGIRVDFV